jgi:hypothetical protein
MYEIVEFFSWIQATIGSFAGLGADDSHSAASFILVVWLAVFGAVCLNHLSERRDNVHLGLNLLVMFAGGVVGNALLRGLQLPMNNEIVLTATLALFGMSVAALVLLLAYHRTEI